MWLRLTSDGVVEGAPIDGVGEVGEVVGEVGNSPENEGPPPSPTAGRRWW